MNIFREGQKEFRREMKINGVPVIESEKNPGVLTFIPALALGPIVERLQLAGLK